MERVLDGAGALAGFTFESIEKQFQFDTPSGEDGNAGDLPPEADSGASGEHRGGSAGRIVDGQEVSRSAPAGIEAESSVSAVTPDKPQDASKLSSLAGLRPAEWNFAAAASVQQSSPAGSALVFDASSGAEGGGEADPFFRSSRAGNGEDGPSFIPSDSLYWNQWHLATYQGAGAALRSIWNEFTGLGVKVGIYDGGVQYDHHDLDGNYDASLHVTVGGSVHDPYPNTALDTPHGTAVAGVIASQADGNGTVGVAFDATISSIEIFGVGSPADINNNYAGFLEALQQAGKFDITNHSWGRDPLFVQFANDASTIAAFSDTTVNGRGGLGTIHLKAAGNDFASSQGDVRNVSRHTLTVAAFGDNDLVSSYSNQGSNILVSAPSNGGVSGITTTDFLGADGYAGGDYTSTFGGTSSATPYVSGVVALMLDANPNLGWRDVQEILSLSSLSAGAGIGTDIGVAANVNEDDKWFFNGADDWNNGGRSFSNDYGFGGVDAYGAVRMAEVWSIMNPTPATSANEDLLYEFGFSPAVAIGEGATVIRSVAATPTTDAVIEHIDLTLTLTHAQLDDLAITVFHNGVTVEVLNAPDSNLANQGATATWTFGIAAFRGVVGGSGVWEVRVTDTDGADAATGTFDSYNWRFWGREAADVGTANTYHYTDEFLWAGGHEASRLMLADSNGGEDWLNFSAMTADELEINLNPNSSTYATTGLRAGQSWLFSIDAATTIENAIAGDGNDTLIGNTAINKLYGMRGDDTYFVQNSGDQVFEFANQGSDTVVTIVSYGLAAAAHVEALRATGAVHVSLSGNNFAQIIVGNDGNNVIRGLGGADVIDGKGGIDAVNYSASATRVNVNLTTGFGFGGDAHGDRFANVENIVGTNYFMSDFLTGNAGTNRIEGLDGDDILTGLGGADLLIGSAGSDTVDYSASASRVNVSLTTNLGFGGDAQGDVFSQVENIIGTNSSIADILTGNGLSNRIDGGDGGDIIAGLAGADVLIGGGGVDVADYSASASRVNVNLTTGVGFGGDAQGDTLSGFENLLGTHHALTDFLTGNAGNNRINGLSGSDQLTGAGGNDIFVFSTPLGPNNVDQVTDFDSPTDLFQIDNAVFTGLANGALAASAFVIGATATTALHRIIYNQGIGGLFFDADGAGGGAQVQFASVTSGIAMTHSDFFVI